MAQQTIEVYEEAASCAQWPLDVRLELAMQLGPLSGLMACLLVVLSVVYNALLEVAQPEK